MTQVPPHGDGGPGVARDAAAWDGALEPLVAVTRGDSVESVHRGVAVLVDETGRVVGGVGDPAVSVLLRSAAKPFQALALVTSGAAQRWALSDEELAVICASHSGSREHLAHVAAILERIELDPDSLACGPQLPHDSAARRELVSRGEGGTRLHNTCSGKHAGMLALARHLGLDSAGYERPEHGVQRRIRETVAGLVGHDRHLWDGTDGCGVPVFRTSAREGAALFARLAAGREPGLQRLLDAMMAHPVLAAGEGRLDTEIMTALPGGVVAKGGAEGVQGLALPATDRRPALGCLIKIEDGGTRPLRVLVAQLLEALGEDRAAARFLGVRGGVVTNTNGSEVGALVPVATKADLVRDVARLSLDARRSPDSSAAGGEGESREPPQRLRVVRGSGNERDVVRFLRDQWPRADEEILGRVYDWRVDRLVLVARKGRRVVGVLRAHLVGGVATVEELIVHEEHRGRGVGTRLLRLLEEQARAQGCHKVILHTPRGARAEAFYRRLGYAREAYLPRYHFGFDYVSMARAL